MPTTPRAAAARAAESTQRSSWASSTESIRPRIRKASPSRRTPDVRCRQSNSRRAAELSQTECRSPLTRTTGAAEAESKNLETRGIRPQAIPKADRDEWHGRLRPDRAANEQRCLVRRTRGRHVESLRPLRPLGEVNVRVPEAGQQPAAVKLEGFVAARGDGS